MACYLSLKTLLFIYLSYELYIDIEETVTGNLNNYHIMIIKLTSKFREFMSPAIIVYYLNEVPTIHSL